MHSGYHIAQVHLCQSPVDFRKSIDGLSVLVEQELGLDLFVQALYVFINRQRTKLNVLNWHRSGFCPWLKRLEAECLTWPDVKTLSPCLKMWIHHIASRRDLCLQCRWAYAQDQLPAKSAYSLTAYSSSAKK